MRNFFYSLFLFVVCATQSYASTLYVVPQEHPQKLNPLYSPNLAPWSRLQPHWQLIEQSLQNWGYELKVVDLFEVFLLQSRLKREDLLLFIDPPQSNIINYQQALRLLPKKKLILFASETTSMRPLLYTQEAYASFGTILTQDDTLIDGVHFIKYYAPYLRAMKNTLPTFSKRHLLTLIEKNVPSSLPNELSTHRRELIRFFEKRKTRDFSFYGLRIAPGNTSGWEHKKFRNYKGIPSSRIGALKRYRFAAIYENACKTDGYFSDKIFTCFAAGTVPVFWGASNVTQYIPKNCFIDRRDFRSTKALYNFLRRMNETEYNRYLTNIRAFLESSQAAQFTPETFVSIVMGQLQKQAAEICVE